MKTYKLNASPSDLPTTISGSVEFGRWEYFDGKKWIPATPEYIAQVLEIRLAKSLDWRPCTVTAKDAKTPHLYSQHCHCDECSRKEQVWSDVSDVIPEDQLRDAAEVSVALAVTAAAFNRWIESLGVTKVEEEGSDD